MGKGRKSHQDGTPGAVTKHVSKWLSQNEQAKKYWHEQAKEVRALVGEGKDTRKAAAQQLAKRLRLELSPQVTGQSKGLQQDLLFEIMNQINWHEIAEDMLER